MLKVLKNLKKSLGAVIIIVILLCVQASTDLALPDYTSKIVNEGIQAGGITSVVPEVIAKEDMDNMLVFTDKDDEILENYTLISANKENKYETQDKHDEKIIKQYFGNDYEVKTDTIYVLKDISDEEEDTLAGIIVDPLMELTTVTSEETSNKIKEQLLQNVPETQKQYMQNMSLMEIIEQMPEEQRNQVLSEFTKQIEQMSDSIKEQAAISSVKQIYINAGINTDDIQNNYIFKTGLQMLGIALITMVCAVTIMLLSSRVAAKLGKTLREKVFKKVMTFSNAELNQFSTASLITRSTNDVQQIQQLITILFRVVVYAPIIGIGGFVRVLTTTDSSMAWIIGVAILAILFIVGTLFAIAMPKFRKLQDLIDKLNEV